MVEGNDEQPGVRRARKKVAERKGPPEVYSIVIECKDEAEQRELFERLKGEGVKVRVLVL